ncbi:nonsense-mediated mRNA decay factor SMG7 [Beta vulgaris subsp. vulgaris]|uniref:nonsense-mediated mRNA decay factor SMG7 n=1 Tax=Beta vulgaris subsp. vulgaris TaxID=3555 RepID=UPI002036DEE5|nr:nonsense-mediated mRNA decay factor SMG7 [Beta vulgaris subsp. vulgaris]
MIVQMEKTPNSKSKDRAQLLYNKNIELEKKRQKSLQAKIPSDPNAWYQIRENYEAIILEDYAFSEQYNVEFALWQVHYKRIEEFRAHFSAAQRSSATNSGRAPLQPDRITKIRVQFKAFLSEATGFYHDLILKIRSKYGLPLGHFTEDSDNGAVMGTDTAKSSDVKKALVSCHRCLIYLGDLARYKGLYGEGESRAREFSAASSYYIQAASLWPSNGNPHHQLAIMSTYSTDELVAVYRYFRSLAAEIPFPTAKDNLVTAFEKNRQSYTQLIETTKNSGDREISIKEKYKEFCTQFVRLHGILFTRTSQEMFATVLSSVKGTFQELLSSGPEEELNFGRDGMENGLAILRVVAILIYTIYNASKKNEDHSYAEILQHNVLCENARALTFELMSLIVERSAQLHDPSSSFLLPGILVFLEWLACCPDFASSTTNEKKPTASKSSFWKHCIALLNKLLSSRLVAVDDDEDEACFTNMTRYEGEAESRLALSEDFELRGFLPLLPAQSILDFSRKQSITVGGNSKEKRTRVKRIIAAGKALSSLAMVDHKSVSFDSKVKQFVIGVQVSENIMPSSNSGPAESPSTEQEVSTMSYVNSMSMRENLQLSFQGDDDDEEIVFKPAPVEKQMDAIGPSWIFPEDSKQGRSTPPANNVQYQQLMSERIPPSGNIAPQHHPVRDLPTSQWLAEQQASLADGLKKLRFVENGHELNSEFKGSLGVHNAGSFLPPQPSVSFADAAMYSDYRRAPEFMNPSKMDFVAFPEVSTDNMVVKPPSLPSAAFRSQGGRPVRHLGPPPGFSPVPPKHVSMSMSSAAATNGSLVADDYSWLVDHHMPSSGSSIGPNHANNNVSLGNSQFFSNMNSSNGNTGLPFPGMQSSVPQFQGGNMKSYSEYQSFRNMNPNHGHKLLEQQNIVTGNHQFNPQPEQYQGQSNWTGQYRV